MSIEKNSKSIASYIQSKAEILKYALIILNENWPLKSARLLRVQISNTTFEGKRSKIADIKNYMNIPTNKEEYFNNLQKQLSKKPLQPVQSK